MSLIQFMSAIQNPEIKVKQNKRRQNYARSIHRRNQAYGV